MGKIHLVVRYDVSAYKKYLKYVKRLLLKKIQLIAPEMGGIACRSSVINSQRT
jgi:hypothetical protein